MAKPFFTYFLHGIKRTTSALLSGSPENRVWGHNRILAEYAGVSARSKTYGRLQHGWVPRRQSRHSYTNCYVRSFVWKVESEIQARDRGWSNFHAIGAPWLYFLENLRSRNVGTDSSQYLESGVELWVFASHSVDVSPLKRELQEFLQFVVKSSSPKKCVILFYTDFQSLKLNISEIPQDISIITLSSSRIDSSSSESLYFSIYYWLTSAKVVILNDLTSMLLYAITLKKPVDLLLKNKEGNLYREQLLNVEQLKSFGISNISNPDSLLEFALEELGFNAIKSPDLIRHLFFRENSYEIFGLKLSFLQEFSVLPKNLILSLNWKLRKNRDI